MGPVVATFYLTNFLATDRKEHIELPAMGEVSVNVYQVNIGKVIRCTFYVQRKNAIDNTP